MTHRHSALTALGCALALALYAVVPTAATTQEVSAALRLVSSRVSIAGTSNIHPYTATTTAVRIARLRLAAGVAGAHVWDEVLKPGSIDTLEIAVAAATLASDKEGLDKNMHKALKVAEHPEIVFRLSGFEAVTTTGARAKGTLRIAGVEREVTLDLDTVRTDATFTVKGQVQLLMTDFGITPPKAMLGMLKTDPKVTVTFETVLTLPLT